MGTKNNPGKFDCYTKAEPDEPMFVLLARDPLAPILVNLWVRLKVLQSGYLSEKTSEAVNTAQAMQLYKSRTTLRQLITDEVKRETEEVFSYDEAIKAYNTKKR